MPKEKKKTVKLDPVKETASNLLIALDAIKILQDIGSLLYRIDSGIITKGGGGADIGPIMREGVPGMGLNVDGSKYFWYHHTNADTWDKLDRDEFNQCVATMAVMAYVVADMDMKLPR